VADKGEIAMLCARDIMTKKVLTVKEDAKFTNVLKLLVENRITGVPVVSDDMRLLGMVTEKDILKSLWYNSNVKGSSAADLMSGEIISFDENDNLMKVFESLVESNFRRVPILSEGKLAGIISRRDIIEFLSKKAGAVATR
jgi:CBS domain-containing protein